MIDWIKQRINQYADKEKQKAEEIKQKEERLKQLEEAKQRGGFHPLQAMNDKKKRSALRKEINEYKEKQKNKKLILGCVAILVVLFTFVNIMAAIDKPDENEATYNEITTIAEATDTLFEKEISSDVMTGETVTEIEIVMTENTTDAATDVASDVLTEPVETTTEVTTTEETTTQEVIITTTMPRDYDEDDAPGVIVPDESETGENLVWVPVNGGTKYHLYKGCSSMENPKQVSVETAINYGYTPCGRCY